MDMFYCGIDAGSTQIHATVLDENGKLVADTEIPTSELHLIAFLDSFKKDEEVKIHLEASELSRWIRSTILERTDIQKIIISDAKRLSWIGKDPHKNDSIDAMKLAEYLRLGRTHPVYYSDDKKMISFKKQVQHQESISAEKTRIKNKIKAHLRGEGIIIKSNLAYSPNKRKDILERIENSGVRRSLKDLYEILDKIEELAQKAEKRLKKASKNWPIIKYFMEVPGVGLILACRFVAYIQTPWRFGSKEKLWTYCKLGLTKKSSNGKLLSSPRLNNNGNSTLKDLSHKAFQGALKTKEKNAIKRAYRRYLDKTKNSKHARLTTQRKIITILWTLWKKNERYDDSKG